MLINFPEKKGLEILKLGGKQIEISQIVLIKVDQTSLIIQDCLDSAVMNHVFQKRLWRRLKWKRYGFYSSKCKDSAAQNTVCLSFLSFTYDWSI